MYGLSNVLQEYLVTGARQRAEALAMLGVCGTAISLVQVACLEGQTLMQTEWTITSMCSLFGFQFCLFGMYVCTSVFLASADAVLFNLSLLTSDLYSVVFSWRV